MCSWNKSCKQEEFVIKSKTLSKYSCDTAAAITYNVVELISLFSLYFPFSCNSDFFPVLPLLQSLSRRPCGSGAEQRHRHQQLWWDWRWQRRCGDVSQAKGLCGKSAALCWLHLLQRGPVSLPRFWLKELRDPDTWAVSCREKVASLFVHSCGLDSVHFLPQVTKRFQQYCCGAWQFQRRGGSTGQLHPELLLSQCQAAAS